MKSQFKQRCAIITQKKMTRKFIFLFLIFFQSLTAYAETQLKATWYRYYDSKGIANISSSVTPNHIRYGYEALDQNMQVIQRNRPYNSETDAKKAPQRAEQAKQNAADLKLKKAYTNSRIAITKRDEALNFITKQIVFQQDQLKQLQKDQIYFKRQQNEYARKGQAIPISLKNNLAYNQKNIDTKRQEIDSLQTYYRSTQLNYNAIISRLKALE